MLSREVTIKFDLRLSNPQQKKSVTVAVEGRALLGLKRNGPGKFRKNYLKVEY